MAEFGKHGKIVGEIKLGNKALPVQQWVDAKVEMDHDAVKIYIDKHLLVELHINTDKEVVINYYPTNGDMMLYLDEDDPEFAAFFDFDD